LFFVIDPAVDAENFLTAMFAEQYRVAFDLQGQLAGRGDDERAWRNPLLALLFGRRVVDQTGEHRDQKCGRFTGAGLGLASDVLPGQRDRQRFGLNGGTLFESGVPDALQYYLRNGKAFKFNRF